MNKENKSKLWEIHKNILLPLIEAKFGKYSTTNIGYVFLGKLSVLGDNPNILVYKIDDPITLELYIETTLKCSDIKDKLWDIIKSVDRSKFTKMGVQVLEDNFICNILVIR